MKYLSFIFLGLLLSCSELIDPPKNLIPKDKMAVIIAEFALKVQINIITPYNDFENSTRFELNKHQIKGLQFVESYKYYTATRDLEKILDDAQQIVLEKDPAAKKYIENKIKENPNAPAFAR
jgi:hypothetical protein